MTMEEEALEAKKRASLRTPQEEQQALKASLVSAARDAVPDDDEDFFQVKDKSAAEREQEDDLFVDFVKKSGSAGTDGDSIMSRYWRADEDMDENEQFLRDYILNKSWLETTSIQKTGAETAKASDGESSESESAKHLEEADRFESAYNFRFEVEEGRQIQGHARF